jgi:mannose-6-phosphate isomerase-like protein (cupin superfamily)
MTDAAHATRLAGGLIAAPGADLVVAEWADPGGEFDPPRFIAPLHVHHADDEAWYVLAGALRVRLGSTDYDVPAGGAILAPRGTPHTYWNPNAEPARYVLVMTPRIRALIDSLHGGSERSIEHVFRAHESEFLGWPSG